MHIDSLVSTQGETKAKKARTSSPGLMFAKATTTISFGTFFVTDALGNTTTQLGVHEWLMRAAMGESATPIGVSEGEDRVCALVENYDHMPQISSDIAGINYKTTHL